MPISAFVDGLKDNPYFGAGFGLFSVGAVVAVARKGAVYANMFLRRHYMMTLEVTSGDPSYSWLLEWLSSRTANHLSVRTSHKLTESGAVTTQFAFAPSVGTHYMWFDSKLIRVERSREKLSMGAQMPFETVQLATFGRSRDTFTRVLNEARRQALAKFEGCTVVYTAVGPEWRQFGAPRRRRPLQSVILADGVAERVIDDVRDFVNNYAWYQQRGVPFRRGYLLHGPPGCGKTSFITSLAGELRYSLCVLSVGDRYLTDDRLAHLLAHAPDQSIILLEDIDAACSQFQAQPQASGADRRSSATADRRFDGLAPLSLSGLLNALDGAISSEARIVFMTTNHIDRLEPALKRPGRIDVIQKVDFCTDEQLRRMLRRFYDGTVEDKRRDALAELFVQRVRARSAQVSAAQAQGHFLLHKHDAERAVQDVDRMFGENLQTQPDVTQR